ncbi:MAG: dipeptidase [Gammaproteobacteria bacterium]|jgi:microsomal dipeptidase-like Zn-dependent dipeptidase
MKFRTRLAPIIILALLAAILLSLHFVVLPRVDARLNPVHATPLPAVPARIRKFHDSVFVADMHADSLLWDRDLSLRHGRGHVDLPRLREGGVDLQVFSAVTRVPRGMNYAANSGDTDILPLLFVAAWRGPATWFSPFERALAQARELKRLTRRAPLKLVTRRADLFADGQKALLSLEGMHALGGDAAALGDLFAAGYRMMGLAHFFDNEIAGSAHGNEKYGLTPLGRSLLPRMEALGITIDLAHASPAAFADTLQIATRPVVVSHGGVAATCPGPRNLDDAQLRAIAANGGVVGIGFWKGAVCEAGIAGIIRALLHAVRVAGIDHVGLGSDFDGAVAAPFDAAELPRLTAALFATGLSDDDIEKLLGGNIRRLLEANLPR